MNRIIHSVAALSLMVAQASAATVNINEGAVSVSRGAGFSPVGSGAQVSPGNKVLVSEGGSATIVFSLACEMQVSSGQVVTIPAEAPCTGLSPLSDTAYVVGGLLVGGGAIAAIALSGGGSHSP